jgi:hypothetical protein
MLTWPEDIQLAVHRGELAAAAGLELAAVSDETHRRFLLGHAVNGGATARTCQAWRIAWQQSGVVNDSTVAQVTPGGVGHRPVEAELPCYFCGDREIYSRLVHIWLCPEALELFTRFRDAYRGGGSDGDSAGATPSQPSGIG